MNRLHARHACLFTCLAARMFNILFVTGWFSDVERTDAVGINTSGCIFHDVTKRGNDVNCGGTQNCYGASPASNGSLNCPPGFMCIVTPGSPGGPGGPGPGGPGPQSVTYDGALSNSNQSYTPAYTASTGWNFATGLGTVGAYNLVMKWSSAR